MNTIHSPNHSVRFNSTTCAITGVAMYELRVFWHDARGNVHSLLLDRYSCIIAAMFAEYDVRSYGADRVWNYASQRVFSGGFQIWRTQYGI